MDTDGTEHSPALDSLYEALSEVQAHLHEHRQADEQDLAQIEKLQRELMDQRDAAAKAGERETYNRLSEQLTMLTRAYRNATHDPGADPLDEYERDEQDPDQPQQEDNDDEETAAGDSGSPGGPGGPETEAGPGDSGAGDQERGDDRRGGIVARVRGRLRDRRGDEQPGSEE